MATENEVGQHRLNGIDTFVGEFEDGIACVPDDIDVVAGSALQRVRIARTAIQPVVAACADQIV